MQQHDFLVTFSSSSWLAKFSMLERKLDELVEQLELVKWWLVRQRLEVEPTGWKMGGAGRSGKGMAPQMEAVGKEHQQ